MENPKDRILWLVQELNHHNELYYMQDKPEISDRDFDALINELHLLEQQFPEYMLPDSPTHRVGGSVNKNFKQVEHRYPMLSLGNTYSEEDLREFDGRIRKLLEDQSFSYVCELKFDGVAIGLRYENGILVQAVTRGDGVRGDDVTDNVKTIRTIPLRLNGNYPSEFEIRGEIILPHSSFEKLNEQRIEEGDEPFANPRNAASGSLKLQNSKEVARRKLDCFLYFLLGENLPETSHYNNLMHARQWGFHIHDGITLCRNLNEVFQFIHYWDEKRKNLLFDIDGVVVKVNETNLWGSLGFTAKSPRWAIAYKFKAERVSTQLFSVSYQVGRTGAITPVANLKPVKLGGTIVKRASLHNADIITNLDIHEGDIVYVEKGGEIIPKIVGVDPNQRSMFSAPVQYITHCPECGTELVRQEGEASHYCPNEMGCPPQIKGKIEHFISRKAMNIDSLGEGKIELLFDKKLVQNIADLYDLQENQLLGLAKTIENELTGKSKKISFREKSVENILKGIEASKQVPFERVLFALGIRFVGETVAKKLAAQFQTMDNLMIADKEALLNTEEIGEKIAESLLGYFSDPKNIHLIQRLKEKGLQFVSTVTNEKLSDTLTGKTFVVSGVFSVSRDDVKKIIELHGGKNVGSISAKTSYVLAGDNMGPEKRKKAEQLNIPIITEEEFNAMICL